jgi:hypothetical protein
MPPMGNENNSGGLGAVLMQDQEAGLRKPVAYASSRLDKQEPNYPVFLAEMQAAVFGMDQFHHFLITGRFTLCSLCKLSSVHVKTLNRLQLKMTELHPDIKYMEGKNNVLANFLSRYHGMNVHVTDVKYDEGRVNTAVAALSHKDLGAPMQMVDASPFRVRVPQNTDSDLKPGYPMIRPLSFRPRSFRPGHFVPWSFCTRSFCPRSFCPLVISSSGHFVPSCHIIQFNSTCVK